MSYLGNEIRANMILCDAADVVGGKLYVLGGGWNNVFAIAPEVGVTLASVLSVPWQLTNRDLHLSVSLLNEDGELVELDEGESMIAEGDLKVGRPPHARPGTPQNVPFVTPFKPTALPAGGYVVHLAIDGKVLTEASFQVIRGENA
jgi:hypothetical protein